MGGTSCRSSLKASNPPTVSQFSTPPKPAPPDQAASPKIRHSSVASGEGLEREIVKVAKIELDRRPDAVEGVKQVRHIRSLLEAYFNPDNAEQRPISIAVFGPPGSGKSYFVKSLRNAVAKHAELLTLNLTQISGVEELASIVEKAIRRANAQAASSLQIEDRAPPIFFFDEIDAPLRGAPLGWLSWFLAPMEDGKLRADGDEVPVGKAVFIFAGGTAETLDAFNQRAQLDPETYRARKVPDFISRLRGVVDIGGVNGLGDARIVPRALALRRELADQNKFMSLDHIERLLWNGHFIHGQRSLRTLVGAGWNKKNLSFDLPGSLLAQHLSRGELDGHLVGISAGLQENRVTNFILTALTRQLLGSGASLVYAGAFTTKGTLAQVVQASEKAPREIGESVGGPRVINYLGDPATRGEGAKLAAAADPKFFRYIPLETISVSERAALRAPADKWFAAMPPIEHGTSKAYHVNRHIAWSLSLFRLRVRVLQEVRVLVVLGGKDDGRSWGRWAGIAEEIMIALALKKPVYVLGAAGGAAKAAGQLLGLNENAFGGEQCLQPSVHDGFERALKPYASKFQIPGETGSPQSIDELRDFLASRGLMTPSWPWNGLTKAENRELFSCPISGDKDANRAVGLILRGLSRIDWKPAAVGQGLR